MPWRVLDLAKGGLTIGTNRLLVAHNALARAEEHREIGNMGLIEWPGEINA